MVQNHIHLIGFLRLYFICDIFMHIMNLYITICFNEDKPICRINLIYRVIGVE